MYSALNEIAQIYPDGAVLIASHGLALATIICKAQGIPVGKAYTLIPDNTEPIWITWDAVL
jgi:alpha-ribazole phosphatase/probable phosphoglycerate mutase